MQWDEIWKIIFCVITSAGGVGGIIIWSIKFSVNKIAERLQFKYETKILYFLLLSKNG